MTVISLPKSHKSLAGCKPGDSLLLRVTTLKGDAEDGADKDGEGSAEGTIRAQVNSIETVKRAKPAKKSPMDYLKSKNTGKLAQVYAP